MNDMFERIDPAVQRLVSPIMNRMTAISMEEAQIPQLGQNHQEKYRNEKLECVHLIFNGNEPEPTLEQTQDGSLKCRVCGRKIYPKFDGTNVDHVLMARQVVEQVMWFGMINNMKPEFVAGCIDLKKMLPVIAQVASELNEYVRREDSSNDTVANMGAEYRFPHITSGF